MRLASSDIRVQVLASFSQLPKERSSEVLMRMLTATICALILTGCASDLPYSIAIGNPNPTAPIPDREQCVLRLDDIAKDISQRYQLSEWTLRNLQSEFEKTLHERTRGANGVSNCKNSKGQLVAKTDYPPLEEIAKKWLTTYALDATDPDQSLDRFREYLLSAKLVRDLAHQQILPDEEEQDTYHLVEKVTRHQSQWCGALTAESSKPFFSFFAQTAKSHSLETTNQGVSNVPSTSAEPSCLNARSLYHVETSLFVDSQGQHDLYETLLDDIVRIEHTATLRSNRYFLLSYEIPWDKEHSLVRYGVTFYFKEVGPQNNTPPSKSELPIHLIGYDLTYANEASPKPEPKTKTDATVETPWSREELWRYTGRPFSLVIGIKMQPSRL